jgi:hypothetical protein
MINNKAAPKSQLSTDLEILHANVKGKSLTFAELKQALKGRDPIATGCVVLTLPPKHPSATFTK